MIATNEAADVLRHGWQDAANTLAADMPEVADLLQARLEMAIACRRLDEVHLLATIAEVEAVAARAGSPSSQALALRLRRTVYEYLLALDATYQIQSATGLTGQPPANGDVPVVAVEEVAALGHAAVAPIDPGPAVDADAGADAGDDAEAEPAGESSAPRRRFAMRRRQQPDGAANGANGDAATDDPLSVPGGSGASDSEAAAPPNWRFSLSADLEDPPLAASDTDALAGDSPTLPREGPAEGELAPRVDGSSSGAAEPVEDPEATASAAFMAPRVGFHILEDVELEGMPDGLSDAPLQMPSFAADERAESESDAITSAEVPATAAAVSSTANPGPDTPAEDEDADSEFLTWRPPNADREAAMAPVQDDRRAPANAGKSLGEKGAGVTSPPGTAPATDADNREADAASDEDEAEASRGWRVRGPGDKRASRIAALGAQTEEDPFANNPRLAETRRRIEERLRRKRCDDAAALLQALAQDTGGRVVAELAMNAGDRCRALGKSNAALNCYLAASRADPVYELPLSRLADICIDDQDTELAVSYLERIARLYRYRGDEKSALKVYRRIATIAPYREDVLALLMAAHSTGRLE